MGFVEALALGVVVALVAGRMGRQRQSAVENNAAAALTVPMGTGATTPVEESVLAEATRRAAEAAVLEPAEVIGDGRPLERLLRGRHESRQERLSADAAERIAELEGTIAAGEDDYVAARAVAERAHQEWQEELAIVSAAAERVDAARDERRQWRRERNALSLLARGYMASTSKWIFVTVVAVALAPLVYLSMDYLDNPLQQGIVTAAASAGIFVVEHALGMAMAHLAQHWSRRWKLVMLLVLALAIGGAIVAAEVYAGVTRDQASTITTSAGAFDPTAAARGVSTSQTEVSMKWTVPLGIAATFGGALIVAMYLLGGLGRELKIRIKDAKTLLSEAREDHRELEPRAERGRERFEKAEQNADAIAGRTARAREEIAGARLAVAHGRDAEDGDRVGNLAAAEIVYHAERARRAEDERERLAAEARRIEENERAESAELRLEERDETHHQQREERDEAHHQQRKARGEARRERRDARKKARRDGRRQRRSERLARIGRAAHAVGTHASDGLRLGGPATTAGLVAAGLGAPVILALAAGSGGLTAAHLLTRSRRPRPATSVSVARAETAASTPTSSITAATADPAHLNGTSINGFSKEHA